MITFNRETEQYTVNHKQIENDNSKVTSLVITSDKLIAEVIHNKLGILSRPRGGRVSGREGSQRGFKAGKSMNINSNNSLK